MMETPHVHEVVMKAGMGEPGTKKNWKIVLTEKYRQEGHERLRKVYSTIVPNMNQTVPTVSLSPNQGDLINEQNSGNLCQSLQ
jgi:hypothetical protein